MPLKNRVTHSNEFTASLQQDGTVLQVEGGDVQASAPWARVTNCSEFEVRLSPNDLVAIIKLSHANDKDNNGSSMTEEPNNDSDQENDKKQPAMARPTLQGEGTSQLRESQSHNTDSKRKRRNLRLLLALPSATPKAGKQARQAIKAKNKTSKEIAQDKLEPLAPVMAKRAETAVRQIVEHELANGREPSGNQHLLAAVDEEGAKEWSDRESLATLGTIDTIPDNPDEIPISKSFDWEAGIRDWGRPPKPEKPRWFPGHFTVTLNWQVMVSPILDAGTKWTIPPYSGAVMKFSNATTAENHRKDPTRYPRAKRVDRATRSKEIKSTRTFAKNIVSKMSEDNVMLLNKRLKTIAKAILCEEGILPYQEDVEKDDQSQQKPRALISLILQTTVQRKPKAVTTNTERLPHIAIPVGKASGTSLRDMTKVAGVYDTGAGLNLGNYGHWRAVSDSYPELVKTLVPIDEGMYNELRIGGIECESAGIKATHYIDLFTPFSENGHEISLRIALSPDLTCNLIFGLPFMIRAKMVMNTHEGFVYSGVFETTFPVDYRVPQCLEGPLQQDETVGGALLLANPSQGCAVSA